MDATVAWEDITPDKAQEYLQLNIENNRNAHSDKIAKLARDMENGDWVPTADPIKFNTAGKLIDGQHRLRGIMKSGITARLLVARNVPDDAVYVIDTGTSRTAAQSLKIGHSDIKNQPLVVAIAQIVNGYEQGVFRTTASLFHGRDRMSTMEVMKYVEANQEILENAATVAASVVTSFPLPPSVVGAAYVILSRVDLDDTAEFFNAIKNGNSGRGEDDPIVTLTRRVYQDKINQRKISHSYALFFIFRTWNAWRDREPLTRLQTGSSHAGYSNMPVPK